MSIHVDWSRKSFVPFAEPWRLVLRTFVHARLGFLLPILFTIWWGCDHGLAPVSPASQAKPYGIRGTIHFSHWPSADSIKDLRLVLFHSQPTQDILTEVLQGRARFTGTLQPYAADSIPYVLYLAPLPPGTYGYISVAQQFGPNIQTDWRAVGLYYSGQDSTTPGSVTVPADSVVPNINISVDFQHPPPQP